MVWSFSKISKALLCPRAFKLEYLDGQKPEATKAMVRGKECHEEIERTILGGNRIVTPIRFAMQASGLRIPRSRILRQARTTSGTEMAYAIERTEEGLYFVQTEVKIGISKTGKVVDFESKECWYRGVVDMVKARVESQLLPWKSAKEIEIFDWKTGSSNGQKRQLEGYAILVYLLYGVANLTGYFVYVTQEKKSKPIKFDLEACWKRLCQDIQKAEEVLETATFPATPNWTCEKSCIFRRECPAHIQRISIAGLQDLKEIQA